MWVYDAFKLHSEPERHQLWNSHLNVGAESKAKVDSQHLAVRLADQEVL